MSAERHPRIAGEAAELRLYRAALHHAPVAIWLNFRGSLVYANPACLALLGAGGEDQVIGRTPFDFIAPEYHDMVRRRIEGVFASGAATAAAEERIIRADGSSVPVEIVAWPVPFAGGQAVQVVMTDISERKRVETEILSSERHIRSVLNALFTFVGVLSPEGVLLEANRAPLEAAGISAADAIGKPFDETYWWSYSPEVQAQLRDAIRKARDGKPSRYDVPVRMKGGQLMTIDFMINPMRDSDGRIMYLIPSAVDISARKSAEEALRRTEARFRAAAEAVADIVWTNNEHGQMEGEQPQWSAFTGQTTEQLQGYGWADALHPGDAQPAIDAWNQAVAERRLYVFEQRVRRRDGVYRRFAVRAIPVFEADGSIREWVGAHRDITGERAVAEAIHESEYQFRQLADGISQLCWIAHPDGHIFWYNRRWYEYTGTTPEQMEGWGWQSVHDPAVLPEVLERWTASIRTGRPFEMTFPLRGADGQFRRFLTRAIPLYDAACRVTRWFGTNTDIDELKRIEDALASSEERFRVLFDASPVSKFLIDPLTGDIVDANQRAAEQLGYPRSELCALRIWDIDRTSDRDRLQRAGAGRLEFESHYHTKSGDEQDVLVTSQHVSVGGRDLVYASALDITHRKRAEEELHRQSQELARSNAELQQFAFAASHDLQEPLRSVSIFTEMLRRKYSGHIDAEADEYINYAVSGAKRMEELIRDLLEYSRLSRDSEPAPVDTNSILDKALFSLDVPIKTSGTVITRHQLPVVLADEVRVQQLFLNIVGNALKYRSTDSAPAIDISASYDGNGYWRFAVKDNGIGIAPQYHDLIFGFFKRLHRDRAPGTGMGLAICKRIVETYGGSIWVESEGDGSGSTFYFTLPSA